jgi:hypothetical protein
LDTHAPWPKPLSHQFTTPEGDKGRIWVSDRKDRGGEDVYWRSAIADAKKEAALARKDNEANRSRVDTPVDLVNGRLRGKVELQGRPRDRARATSKGFLGAALLRAGSPRHGCGPRLVLCQFRGNKVCLYHYREDGQWTRSTTIWRDVFKDLVAANKRYRIKARRPHLKLVISNPSKFDERVSDAA